MENKDTYTKNEVITMINAYKNLKWQIEEMGRHSILYGINEVRKGILNSVERFRKEVPSDFNAVMDVNPSKLEKKFKTK